MVHLNWTLQAEMDLKSIFDYISSDSKRYASIHVKRIREKAKLIQEHPRLGRVVPELGDENIKELIFGNYRIILHYSQTGRTEAKLDKHPRISIHL